jgi:hypothetical protein
MSLEEFMEGKNKPFKRMATAYLIRKMMDKYRATFDRSNQVGFTSTPLQKRLAMLSKYVSDHYYLPGYSGGSGGAKDFSGLSNKYRYKFENGTIKVYPVSDKKMSGDPVDIATDPEGLAFYAVGGSSKADATSKYRKGRTQYRTSKELGEASVPAKKQTPEQWNAAWAKLKPGQQMVGLDGKTYTKK